uniref:Uncharacterized protein n=1 Tax=Rhizophora mucronata TaxID=61149 RepID=A0A2P2PS90_RHIMU
MEIMLFLIMQYWSFM